jgi:hypothetical protein
MLRSSTFPRPAISKFRNVYDQVDTDYAYGYLRFSLLLKLREIALFCRHNDTRRHRHIGEIRKIALWFGPFPQLGCCRRLLYGHMLYVPTKWREQVKELVVALEALTAAQASLMSREMVELLMPHFTSICLRILPALADERSKEERSVKTESTDSDSYSTY